jgi:selenoprotein W-related protein
VLSRFRNALEQVALVPSSGGAFEVLVDGNKLYSKLETGRFPTERQILEDIETAI